MKMRDSNWDIFKGIAIYLVVLGHLTTSEILKMMIYAIHMPMFFLASGYFAYYSVNKYGIRSVCKKKIHTILIPWISWSFVAFAMNCLKALLDKKNGTWLHIFREKFIAVYVFPMSVWYLWALFIVFLIFASFFGIGARKSLFCYLILWILSIVLLDTDYMAVNKIQMYFFWFVLGFYMHSMGIEEKGKNVLRTITLLYIPMTILVIVFVPVSEFWKYNDFNLHDISLYNFVVFFLFSIYSVLGVFFWKEYGVKLIRKVKLLESFFSKIGTETLEIYTIHMMFVSYVVFVPLEIRRYAIICNGIYMPLYAAAICLAILWLTKVLHKFRIYNRLMKGELVNK